MTEPSADVHGDVPDTGDVGDASAPQDLNADLGADFDLGDDEFMLHVRERRIAEMKKAMSEVRDAVEHRGHGEYREIEEAEFLKEVTESDRVVCHFYHPEFRRCAIVDSHLQKIARKYLTTKFIKINVLKASFFVVKLNIKILPAIVMFKKGVAFDRVVGFDEFGGSDDFATGVLEKRLGRAGVIDYKEKELQVGKKSSVRVGTHNRDRSGDSDLDSSDGF